jgi:predicted O-linked N-acetylglucosamine transferase (SPINDLY family)
VPTIAEARALAAHYYQVGDLGSAEQICRQMLAADPRDVYALHLLGLVAFQAGRAEQAVDLLAQALHLQPGLSVIHNSLGVALTELGRFEEALASLREALRLRPDYAEAYNNHGNAQKKMGRNREAEASYREALRLRPDFVLAHNNLGLVLAEERRAEEALASIGKALQLQPDYAEAHHNRGNVYKRLGRWQDAAASYREGLRLWPDHPQFHNDLGVIQAKQRHFVEAEACFRAAVRLQPANADFLNNLGSALTEQERFAEAEACYREALRMTPDCAETHYNLGFNYAAQGNRDEARPCFEGAVRIKKDYPEAIYRLGVVWAEQGFPDRALDHYRHALALRPDDPAVQSSLLLLYHYRPDYEPAACFAEHLRWGRQFELQGARGAARDPDPSPRQSRDPHRRLRVGYVSGDFCAHVMGRYSEAVIASHDRSQVEVFCYANVHREDAFTRRIKALADHWRSVPGLPDEGVAQLIREDRIDILVDLSGHTGGNRLRVFALRPAPVQVTHCGYPDTTGLAAIDYRLTDPYCDPPGQTERWHIEKVVRLPEAHWCYAPPALPEVNPLPAQEPGAVTFASFNNPAKITGPMLALWARILQKLPRARMVVQCAVGRAGEERVRATLAANGIEAGRLRLLGRESGQAYYHLYHDVDICLDTYPYASCNITADALWMGVPVVTLAGPTCVTRLGVSAIVLAGLEDLVTDSEVAYVETAVRLANDLPRLKELRACLRGRAQGTLGNVERFTRQLEAAYRDMWQTYCKEEG